MPRAVDLLLAATIAITVSLAAFMHEGAPLAVMAAGTFAIAFAGWQWTTTRRRSRAPVVFDLYVATLVVLIALYAEQWHGRAGGHAFIAIFPLASSAVFTLGALCWWWRLGIGDFAAWTVFAWGCVAAVSVYLAGPLGGHAPRYVPGMIAAPLVFVIALAGAVWLVRRDNHTYERAAGVPAGEALGRRTIFSVALVALFIPAYATVLYLQAGLLVVAIVCGAMVAGFVVWLRTTLRRPPSPSAILPAYLVTLALFLFHVLEEHLEDFAGRIAAAAHVHWSATQFVEVIVLLGPAIWIAGAIGIRRRHPLGNYIAWFLFVGMMLGEPAHVLVFPFMEGGRYHYFPGMWTSLFPMVPAAYGIWRMLHDDRRARAGGRPTVLHHPAA